MKLFLGLLLLTQATAGFSAEAPVAACRVKPETIEQYGTLVKNAGCAIMKYDQNKKPTHVLVYSADIDGDGLVDGLSLPGGKRSAMKYDKESVPHDETSEGDPKFSTIAEFHNITYTETSIHTACRETKEETRSKMEPTHQGLDVIVLDLINPDDKYFLVFECLAPDIENLSVSFGNDEGDFRWVNLTDVKDQSVKFNYSNREIISKALSSKTTD